MRECKNYPKCEKQIEKDILHQSVFLKENFLKEFSSSGFALTGDALKYERQRYDGWCDPAFCYCCCYCYYHWYHGCHHCCKWQQIQLQIGTTTWRIRTGAQWITASPGRLQRRTGAFKKKGTGAFQKKAQVLLNDNDKTNNKGTGAFQRQRQNQELIKVDIIHYCIKFKFVKTENYIISDGTYTMNLSN